MLARSSKFFGDFGQNSYMVEYTDNLPFSFKSHLYHGDISFRGWHIYVQGCGNKKSSANSADLIIHFEFFGLVYGGNV